MEPTSTPTPSTPNARKSRIVSGIIILFLAAVVGFAIMMGFEGIDEHLDAQGMFLESIQDRVVRIEERLNASSTSATSGKDARPLMPTNYRGESEANFEPATETVLYRNDAAGFEAKLPFNPKWGNAQYRIEPFTEEAGPEGKQWVWFGPAGPFEGGGWARWFYMTVGATTTIEASRAGLLAAEQTDLVTTSSIRTLDLGDKKVLLYQDGGLCTYIHVRVFGPKATLELSPICGDEKWIEDILLDVARSIKFL